MNAADPPLDTESLVTPEDFDRLFADSAGPYLRIYLTLRLGQSDSAPSIGGVLEDVYAGLLASRALIYSGERKGFQTRVYGIVDRMLPHLGEPALRKLRPAALDERARRFVQLVAERWHGGFADQVRAIESLSPREREAVLLRDFHEWTMQEIARKLGMPIDEARAFVGDAQARVRSWKAPRLPVSD